MLACDADRHRHDGERGHRQHADEDVARGTALRLLKLFGRCADVAEDGAGSLDEDAADIGWAGAAPGPAEQRRTENELQLGEQAGGGCLRDLEHVRGLAQRPGFVDGDDEREVAELQARVDLRQHRVPRFGYRITVI